MSAPAPWASTYRVVASSGWFSMRPNLAAGSEFALPPAIHLLKEGTMADQVVNNSGGGGGGGGVYALLVVIVILIIGAALYFGGVLGGGDRDTDVDVKIEAPDAPAPAAPGN